MVDQIQLFGMLNKRQTAASVDDPNEHVFSHDFFKLWSRL